MRAAELYEKDFSEWARQNAKLLRSGRVGEADLENIAEEIEDLSKRERRSLHRRLTRLIQHLLKWQYQAEKRSSSWERTIIEQRDAIREILEGSPSLRRGVADAASKAYPVSVKLASADTRQPATAFPDVCPYRLEELLEDGFLPASGSPTRSV